MEVGFFGFSLSRDGSRVAYVALIHTGPFDVWVLDLADDWSTRISFKNAFSPQWSPDGKQLYYTCRKA